jgi:hypothetical protein
MYLILKLLKHMRSDQFDFKITSLLRLEKSRIQPLLHYWPPLPPFLRKLIILESS